MQRLLLWLGVTGIFGMVIRQMLVANEWGNVGTSAYDRYELYNRLLMPLLLLQLTGMIGVYRALVTANRIVKTCVMLISVSLGLMIIGNIAEFWVFTDVPYDAGSFWNARNLSWFTYLFGWLLLLIWLLVLGIVWWRSRFMAWWMALILCLTLPFTFLGFSIHSIFLWMYPLAFICIFIRIIVDAQPMLIQHNRSSL